MAELQIMRQPQTEPKYICSLLVPLTTDITSQYYKYYDTVSKTWKIPVSLLPNKYRFRLIRTDYSILAARPDTDFTLVCDQLKMLFSPVQDFIMNINSGTNPYYDPLVSPLDFVGSVNGVLNYAVWGNVIGIQPLSFSAVYLTYEVYLE